MRLCQLTDPLKLPYWALKSPKPDQGPRGLPYLEGTSLTATGAFHGLQHVHRYAHII